MQADLAYLVPSGRDTRVDLTNLVGDEKLLINRVSVDIAERDVNAADPLADLAARGFTAVPFSGGILGSVVDAAWRLAFATEVARTVKAVVGAREVVVMTGSVTIRRGAGKGAELALQTIHTDFTASSAVAKFAAMARAKPDARSARRFAAYNAWWPATPSPHDKPLALCDAATVAPADLMATSVVTHNPKGEAFEFGEIGLYRYNPRHRWSCYPDIGPDSMLLFAGHDSDPLFASQVPHCAFVNSQCPPDAPSRASVECRMFAYW